MAENRFEDPSSIIIPGPLSDRDKAMINKMFKKAFSNPPARPRKPSHNQERRLRAKERKNKETDLQ
jgi:hypothetical protein